LPERKTKPTGGGKGKRGWGMGGGVHTNQWGGGRELDRVGKCRSHCHASNEFGTKRSKESIASGVGEGGEKKKGNSRGKKGKGAKASSVERLQHTSISGVRECDKGARKGKNGRKL